MLSTWITVVCSIAASLLAAVFTITPALSVAPIAAETHKLTARVVKLRSGVTLEYVEQGDRSGVPVVLLHGYTDSWRSYERVLPHLPRSLRVFAVSQRGHGNSDRPVTGYEPRDFATDVVEFMDALAIPRAVIVGHSMGGSVAQRFAVDHRDRLRALVLIGAFFPKPANPQVREFWDASVSKLADPIDPGFVREFQTSTVAQPVPAEFLDDVIRQSLKVPARVWQAALKPFLTMDFARELTSVTIPTLILWGDRDAFTPRSEQDALQGAIRDSELVVFAGTGHCPNWEEPVRVAALLTRFVDRVAPQQGSGAK
jgi:pimeloyl-ACP methyl ester carboxylesterase